MPEKKIGIPLITYLLRYNVLYYSSYKVTTLGVYLELEKKNRQTNKQTNNVVLCL